MRKNNLLLPSVIVIIVLALSVNAPFAQETSQVDFSRLGHGHIEKFFDWCHGEEKTRIIPDAPDPFHWWEADIGYKIYSDSVYYDGTYYRCVTLRRSRAYTYFQTYWNTNPILSAKLALEIYYKNVDTDFNLKVYTSTWYPELDEEDWDNKGTLVASVNTSQMNLQRTYIDIDINPSLINIGKNTGFIFVSDIEEENEDIPTEYDTNEYVYILYGAKLSGIVEIQPTVTVNLTDLDRVPIFDSNAQNDQSVAVTLSPDPLPSGKSVTLELVTVNGTGDATFDNGQKSMSVSNSTTVKIRGVTNSSEKDNIKLIAKLDGVTLDEVAFSVRTWPINFRRISTLCNPMVNGNLVFSYTWDSESGNHNDLDGIFIGEHVDYPGAGPKYNYQDPPWGKCFAYDPFIKYKTIGREIFTEMPDTHGIPCGFFSRPEMDSFKATQVYWFRDPVYMDVPFSWDDPSSYRVFQEMGTIDIYRSVFFDSINWIYRVEKHGCIGEMPINFRMRNNMFNSLLLLLLNP